MPYVPSWFNYQWEDKHHLDTHSTQAPEREWNKWRNANAQEQLSKYWEGLIRDWKQQKDYKIAFYLPFERLVDIKTGPQLLIKLADELRTMLGVQQVADNADIPCLWYKIVKGGGSNKDKRAPHKYIPSYTTKQRDDMLSSLQNMQQEFADDSELVDILSMYMDDIQNNIRIIDDAAASLASTTED